MKLMPKLEIKLFALLHNLFLMSLSLYMFLGILNEALKQNYSLFGNISDDSGKGLPVCSIPMQVPYPIIFF